MFLGDFQTLVQVIDKAELDFGTVNPSPSKDMNLVVMAIMLVDVVTDVVAVVVQEIRIEQVVDKGSFDIDIDLNIGFLLELSRCRIDDRFFVV